MFRQLSTTVGNHKTACRLLIVCSILLLLGAYFHSQASSIKPSGVPKSQARSSEVAEPGADRAAKKHDQPGSSVSKKQEAPKTTCFKVTFAPEMLEKVCAPNSNPALCRVAKIDHLDRSEFTQARLQHPTGHMTMLVHPSWDLISQSILNTGAWEQPQTNFIRSSLELLPGAGLLDVGSQLGVYSLHAAQMGRQAVAIDAFYQNSIRLFASVTANGFQDRVRVYWNALALQSNGKMNMFLPNTCNVGGGGPRAKGVSGITDSIDVRTVPLDEIVIGDGCFSGVKELVVKADMEGHEWLVMATGAEVFKRFKVSVIMMEWAGTKVHLPDKAPGIIEFYKSHGLLPHTLSGTRLQLLGADFKAWPWDIFWATKEFAAKKT